jgi:hypothetical protein
LTVPETQSLALPTRETAPSKVLTAKIEPAIAFERNLSSQSTGHNRQRSLPSTA